jgi:hypothetical protein
VEQEYCVLGVAQYVPKRGSVKPPDAGHCQLFESEYIVGIVVQTVAASFQARHAFESPALDG